MTSRGIIASVAWLGALVGLVAMIQGVAWLGGARTGRRRRMQGGALAPIGLALFVLSLLHLLVPEFWGVDPPTG